MSVIAYWIILGACIRLWTVTTAYWDQSQDVSSGPCDRCRVLSSLQRQMQERSTSTNCADRNQKLCNTVKLPEDKIASCLLISELQVFIVLEDVTQWHCTVMDIIRHFLWKTRRMWSNEERKSECNTFLLKWNCRIIAQNWIHMCLLTEKQPISPSSKGSEEHDGSTLDGHIGFCITQQLFVVWCRFPKNLINNLLQCVTDSFRYWLTVSV